MKKVPVNPDQNLNVLDNVIMEGISSGRLSSYQGLALRIIKTSVRDYLYFILGDNGITPEHFLNAYYYLYSPPRINTNTPQEIKEKYFRTHYDISELGECLCIHKFLATLQKLRYRILLANKAIVISNLETLRNKEWQKVYKKEEHKPFKDVKFLDVIKILTTPENPVNLAKLVCFESYELEPVVKETWPKYKSFLF